MAGTEHQSPPPFFFVVASSSSLLLVLVLALLLAAMEMDWTEHIDPSLRGPTDQQDSRLDAASQSAVAGQTGSPRSPLPKLHEEQVRPVHAGAKRKLECLSTDSG